MSTEKKLDRIRQWLRDRALYVLVATSLLAMVGVVANDAGEVKSPSKAYPHSQTAVISGPPTPYRRDFSPIATGAVPDSVSVSPAPVPQPDSPTKQTNSQLPQTPLPNPGH